MITPHVPTGPGPSWQAPLGWEEPRTPTFSQLGAATTDGATEWRPAGDHVPFYVASADDEAGAVRKAAKFARNVEGYEQRYRSSWSLGESIASALTGGSGGTIQKPAGVAAVGSSPHRLPMLVVETPWDDTKPLLVVPTEGLRDGTSIRNIAMPEVGTHLSGGFSMPEQYGGFYSGYPLQKPAQGRVVAMTDGERIVRFAPDTMAGTVELLERSRGGRGRIGMIAGGAALALAAGGAAALALSQRD